VTVRKNVLSCIPVNVVVYSFFRYDGTHRAAVVLHQIVRSALFANYKTCSTTIPRVSSPEVKGDHAANLINNLFATGPVDGLSFRSSLSTEICSFFKRLNHSLQYG